MAKAPLCTCRALEQKKHWLYNGYAHSMRDTLSNAESRRRSVECGPVLVLLVTHLDHLSSQYCRASNSSTGTTLAAADMVPVGAGQRTS